MRNYEHWIKAYMEYTKFSEAPDVFHFWTAVSVIAGALRRHVWIDQRYFQWTPNMYIIFVAPPGIVSKSTTASIGMNLLRRVDGVHFGPDTVTWQALLQGLSESTEMFQLQDGSEEYHTMSAITILSSEFGNFLNPHDREMVDVMVSLWDGQIGAFHKRTKTAGADVIENPWINVLACTTPDWIAGNFPEYMIGGGFTSRCVFVYSEKKRSLVAYPGLTDPMDDERFRDVQNRLIQDLGHMANTMMGEYQLSLEARALGESWYEEHYERLKTFTGDKMAGYAARKQTHVHKLAMVLAAAESDKLVIEKDHLAGAIRIVGALEADMPKVFSNIGLDTKQKEISGISHVVWTQGKVRESKLYQLVWNKMSVKEFQTIMEGAMYSGFVKRVQIGSEFYWVPGEVRPN